MTSDSDSTRRRLLLSAYAILPDRGSEPGVGWHRALYAATKFDVWVICPSHHYDPFITSWIEKNGRIRGLSFVPVPLSRCERSLHLKTPYAYLVYNRWQRRVFMVAQRLHRLHQFDIIHHVTWNGFREPGYLWKIDVPFIWGPVGGTQNYPWRFLFRAGLAGAVSEGTRTLVNRYQLLFGRRVRTVARRSALVLAANSTGSRDLSRLINKNVEVLAEAGVENSKVPAADSDSRNRPLRILWSGALRHCKALHLLLEALGNARKSLAFELRIVGDGGLRPRWQRLAKRLGIADRCDWLGQIPHEEAVDQNLWADVLVFSSMRDTSGNVVLEALASGVPVICFDHFGAGDVVTSECGIKIPVLTPGKAISALADALIFLAQNPQVLKSLSIGALKRARECSWDENGMRMIAHYQEVLARMNSNERGTEKSQILPSQYTGAGGCE